MKKTGGFELYLFFFFFFFEESKRTVDDGELRNETAKLLLSARVLLLLRVLAFAFAVVISEIFFPLLRIRLFDFPFFFLHEKFPIFSAVFHFTLPFLADSSLNINPFF